MSFSIDRRRYTIHTEWINGSVNILNVSPTWETVYWRKDNQAYTVKVSLSSVSVFIAFGWMLWNGPAIFYAFTVWVLAKETRLCTFNVILWSPKSIRRFFSNAAETSRKEWVKNKTGTEKTLQGDRKWRYARAICGREICLQQKWGVPLVQVVVC